MILFEKFGQHQPLNRQAERYAREGIDISLSTLADQVGARTVALEPIHSLIRVHVLAATRLHGDDTTVPLLACGGTRQARLWTYVRDDRPFAGGAPPAALFFFSTDREKVHPNRHLDGCTGILQADAYGGYNDLYREDRKPGPVTSALCWSHARRKFFELADIAGNVRKGKPAHAISTVALAAVTRMDALFAIERDLNGLDAEARREARQRLSHPLVDDLNRWLLTERSQMSKHNPVADAIDYMFEKSGRWEAFTRFLDDGRICLTNNAAERALRGIALGRKAWLFAGSERGGDRAAFMLHTDRHRQAQRYRSAGMAGRYPRPFAEHAGIPPARIAPVELGGRTEQTAGRRLMTRLPDLSEEERNSLLRSLTEVGPAKPIGYLPLQTIEKFLRLTPEALAAAAIAQGLSTAQLAPPPVSCIKSGALYVYHREALANLLQANADAVSAAALSLDPDDFVVRIATVWFEESHPAHKIIAKAFGDRG